jgi:ubiquinone/menaquinone biosynthesis C-methylase UbiE
MGYFENTKHRAPSRLLLDAISFATGRDRALDLGAGALNDAFCLLKEGFGHVTALDIEPMAESIVGLFPRHRFDYRISSFEDFEFPSALFDLVSAQYSLPFIAPDRLSEVWAKIATTLKPGGILTGQFFGDRDDWRNDPTMNFHTAGQARELLSGLRTLLFDEEESPGRTAMGEEKHWHVFHFIASK